MAYFRSQVIEAAAYGPLPICIKSAYPDDTERLLVDLAGAPSDVDAERLAREYGRILYREGEGWFLAPLSED